MSVLFLCSTYMQLINAIQLKKTIIKKEYADIIINDHSRNSEEVAGRLEKLNLFDRVRMVKNKDIMFKQTFIMNIEDVFSINFGKNKKFRKMLWDNMPSYDRIYFYNMDLLLLCIWDVMIEHGNRPKLIRFEEGMISYPALDVKVKRKHYEGMRMKLTRLVRKALLRNTFHDYITTYCVYFPEIFKEYISDFYEDSCDIKRIPLLSYNDTETINILNHVFAYKPEKDRYPWKYIYLASSMDFDGAGIGEHNLVCKFANYVGKENILIKMHPRDTSQEYEKSGFTVSRNSVVPWELVLLNNNFSHHIFVSLCSSSMVTGPALLGKDIESYYLYPMVTPPKKEIFQKIIKDVDNMLEQFHKNGMCKKCIKISDMEMFRRQKF